MMSRIRDAWHLVQLLTLRRIWNAIKVFSSYHYSRAMGQNWHRGNPISFSIEPTTACNLRCPECPSGMRSFTRPTGSLQEDFFARALEQLASDALFCILYFQGEPYLNPNFLNMVSRANARKLYTITSTNGHFLDDLRAKQTVRSGLKRLIISIDGTTQETYSAYRKGGDLDRVISGTRKVIHWKKQLKSKTPHVVFQFLVVKPNEHQINEVYRLAADLGVDEVKLKTAQIYDYQSGHPLIPTQERYARYRLNKQGKYELKHKLLDQCWKMWHSAVITWDGKVVPCCFDKDASHPMGDLQTKDFTEIWQGLEYSTFRTNILRGRKHIDICTNCTEGCAVWA